MSQQVRHFPRGLTIGLFGGSFDPPHDGHRQVSLTALNRLGFDYVWWLVSPQNPLKARAPDTIAGRLAAAQKLARHPHIHVSDPETALGTRYAIDTVRALKARNLGVHFIWLMGADNFATLHHWRDWQALMAEVPIAVYPRPGHTLRAMTGMAATRFAQYRHATQMASAFKHYRAPGWILLQGRLNHASSTALRHNRDRQKAD